MNSITIDVNHLFNFSHENDNITEILSVDKSIDNMIRHSKDEVEINDDT